MLAEIVLVAALVAMTVVALLGWTTAARLSRRSDMAEALARYAEERNQSVEIAAEQIRINETNARWEAATANERAQREALRASALQHQLSMLAADLAAMKTPTDEDERDDDLYDSTTNRLRKFPALAAKPDV